MTSIFYKTAQNYRKTKESEPAHVPQPFLNYGGLTKMISDDYKYIPKENDMAFTKTESILKRPMTARERYEEEERIKREKIKKMEQRSITNNTNPNSVEEAPVSFWMTHINSSDMYHSFIKGTNPWARSSAFTQPFQRTRGAFCYYQNAINSPMNQGFPGSAEEQKRLMIEQELAQRRAKDEEIMRQNIIGQAGIRQYIVEKIIRGCSKKGWIGLRGLKCLLRSISPHKCDIIDKNSFKFYLAKQGILLELDEVNEICDVYDYNHNGHINYIQFLDAIRTVSENRGKQIEEFKEQVKERNQNCIIFSKLLYLADMRFHPEAIMHLKNIVDLRKEYENNWDALKIDDTISEEHFRQFFYDISSCVKNDNDFTQILKALGYK